MLCESCGREIPNDAVLCPYCGQAVRREVPPTPPVPPPRKRTATWIAIAALITIAVVCFVCVLCAAFGTTTGGTNNGGHDEVDLPHLRRETRSH